MILDGQDPFVVVGGAGGPRLGDLVDARGNVRGQRGEVCIPGVLRRRRDDLRGQLLRRRLLSDRCHVVRRSGVQVALDRCRTGGVVEPDRRAGNLDLLRRVRDFAQVRADGKITISVAKDALDLLEVDRHGLDEIDRKIMLTIIQKYGGGPVGINTIAASIDEEASTIEDVYEPYLMQLGFLDRTRQGRVATIHAFEYFGLPRPQMGGQPSLF